MLGNSGVFGNALAVKDPGNAAFNVLRVANNVAGGQGVVIGTDEYEIEIVNTNSTDSTAGGDFNNTTDELIITRTSNHFPMELFNATFPDRATDSRPIQIYESNRYSSGYIHVGGLHGNRKSVN